MNDGGGGHDCECGPRSTESFQGGWYFALQHPSSSALLNKPPSESCIDHSFGAGDATPAWSGSARSPGIVCRPSYARAVTATTEAGTGQFRFIDTRERRRSAIAGPCSHGMWTIRLDHS